MQTQNLDYLYKQTQPVEDLVGKTVCKSSGKPFKSGDKEATISGFKLHDITKKLCFTFEEDDSYVECFRCNLVKH